MKTRRSKYGERGVASPRSRMAVVGAVTALGAAACSAEAGLDGREETRYASTASDTHGDASAGDGGRADADADAAPPPDATEPPRIRVVREVTGDEAAALASRPVENRATCRAAWLALEATRAPADVRGDPFPVLPDADVAATWALRGDAAGHAVTLVPSAFEEIAVTCGNEIGARARCAPVTCDVPVAWQGLDVGVSVAIDPVLKLNHQMVGSGPRKNGSDSVGGIFVRYAPTSPEDPFDVIVAWYLEKPRLDAGEIAKLRAAWRIPAPQPLALAPLADQAAVPGGQSVLAVQMSAREDGSDAAYWGIFGGQLRATYAARGIDNSLLRFGAPSHASTAAKAAAAVKPVALYALSPWAPFAATAPVCGGFVENDPAKRCDGMLETSVGALLDATLARGRDLFARFVWQEATYGGVYVTTVRVTPAGDVAALRTEQVDDLAPLGLPPPEVLAGL